MDTALNSRLPELATQNKADRYNEWLAEKIAQARQSPIVSHEEALAHFAAKRAERTRTAPQLVDS